MAKAKERMQVLIDAKQAEVTEMEGIATDYDTEKAEEIAAAEAAILESVGQLNGDGKLYSDKEWNDEKERRDAIEADLRTQVADLGAKVDGQQPALDAASDRAAKAEAKFAKAKAAYAAQQASETESEDAAKIFESEDESGPTSEPTV